MRNANDAASVDSQIEGQDGVWSAIDYSSDKPVLRKFRAQFTKKEDAVEFEEMFHEVRRLGVGSRFFLLLELFHRNVTHRQTVVLYRTRSISTEVYWVLPSFFLVVCGVQGREYAAKSEVHDQPDLASYGNGSHAGKWSSAS